MNKKEVRRAAMIKLEKRKKIILLSVCAVIALAIILVFIIPPNSNDSGEYERRNDNAAQDNNYDNDDAVQDNKDNKDNNGSNGNERQGSIDIDLTAMSSTMVYAAVLNIMRSPGRHAGQTIRVSGTYHPFFWDETGLYYHYVIVDGQPGCCPQRMEFKLSDNYVFPDDFPPEGAMIEITGVFGSYQEMGHTFFYLAVGYIIVLD